jgi:hypothetical protein
LHPPWTFRQVESITCPLGQLIRAVTQEGEQAEVAEDLELLANFGADVGIVGVQSREGIFEGVDVSKIESRFRGGSYRGRCENRRSQETAKSRSLASLGMTT